MRIASFILGFLVLFSTHIEVWDTNFFDFLCVIVYMAMPAALIITPMILEFMEHKVIWNRSKKQKDKSDTL